MRRAKPWLTIGLYTLCWLLLASCGRQAPTDPSEPSVSNFLPTPFKPQEVGERLVGPTVYTVDARDQELWMYFDFSRASVVAMQNPKTDDWDLAFRRHVVRTNGGDTNPTGQGALLSIPDKDFAAITQVPADAVFVSDVRTKKRLNVYNPAIQKWYNYSYTANVLTPKPIVYIVRTQDGKYAKIRFLSYYCKGSEAGCMTFEYVYQGDGSTNLAASSAQVSHYLEKR
jgi:HmuY protein